MPSILIVDTINTSKIVLNPTASASAPTGTEGALYYDSDEATLMQHDGTEWAPMYNVFFVRATGPDGHAGFEDGDYKYHVFNATKTGLDGFVVSQAGTSKGSNTLEYLIVAGGGSGRTAGSLQTSGWGRGGGGAGGYRIATDMVCPAVGNHNVTVGLGGSTSSATSGGDSVFNGITATGGGKGGGDDFTVSVTSGGSGGGAGGGSNITSQYTGGEGIYDGGTIGSATWQGRDGGDTIQQYGAGAGGGGASQEGATTSSSGSNGLGGAGGDGTVSSITGSGVTRGGGGGGCGNVITLGGSGGGGASTSTYSASAAGAGQVNTGGGGGGGSYGGYGNGADGGSGVVIIRYKFQ